MLLIQRYVFPVYPELKSAEFVLSITAVVTYVICRRVLSKPAYDRLRHPIHIAEKILEVYIGVTVVSSLLYTLIMSIFG